MSLPPCEGSAVQKSTSIAGLHKKLGTPSGEVVESLRLLKAFVKLAPPQRREVLQMAERLANEDLPFSEHPLSCPLFGCWPNPRAPGDARAVRCGQLDARSR